VTPFVYHTQNAYRAELDDLLVNLAQRIRWLTAVSPVNAQTEHARLLTCAVKAKRLAPRWVYPHQQHATPTTGLSTGLRRLRQLAIDYDFEALYMAKVEELEAERELIGAIGNTARLRQLLKHAPSANISTALHALSCSLLSELEQPAVMPSKAPRQLDALGQSSSVEQVIHEVARALGLSVSVAFEPRLLALAAAGEGTVWLSASHYELREAYRLAVHEVMGHLACARNGTRQPWAIFAVGTAQSFEDHEGLAVYMEEHHGLLCSSRLRTLAGRVVASRCWLDHADFDETFTRLHKHYGFSTVQALKLTERTYRGGGCLRGLGYLRGFVNVRSALAKHEVSLAELMVGRVGLREKNIIRRGLQEGRLRPPLYRLRPHAVHNTWPERAPLPRAVRRMLSDAV